MAKRLFFTQFGWNTNDDLEIIRNLKLFSLINEELVIPSNLMYSEKCELVLRNNPELLELRIIRPALPSRYDNIPDYIESRKIKAGRDLTNYISFLKNINISPLPYEDNLPASLFTQNCFEQIGNEESILCKSAKITCDQSKRIVELITIEKEKTENVILFRDFLSICSKCVSDYSFAVVLKYAELLRYICGASSKQCNNFLPQENMIDWCLANYENPNSFVLNDSAIFWEVFFESLLRTTDGIFSLSDLQNLSEKTLDRVDFYGIQQIREQSCLQESFIKTYDSIISKVNTPAISDGNPYRMMKFDELIDLKEKLRLEFKNELSDEVAFYKKIEITESLLKIAYQLFGGTIQSLESVVNFFSVMLDKKNDWDSYLTRQEQRIQSATKYATKFYSDEPVLIEYMQQLTSKAKSGWYK